MVTLKCDDLSEPDRGESAGLGAGEELVAASTAAI